MTDAAINPMKPTEANAPLTPPSVRHYDHTPLFSTPPTRRSTSAPYRSPEPLPFVDRGEVPKYDDEPRTMRTRGTSSPDELERQGVPRILHRATRPHSLSLEPDESQWDVPDPATQTSQSSPTAGLPTPHSMTPMPVSAPPQSTTPCSPVPTPELLRGMVVLTIIGLQSQQTGQGSSGEGAERRAVLVHKEIHLHKNGSQPLQPTWSSASQGTHVSHAGQKRKRSPSEEIEILGASEPDVTITGSRPATKRPRQPKEEEDSKTRARRRAVEKRVEKRDEKALAAATALGEENCLLLVDYRLEKPLLGLIGKDRIATWGEALELVGVDGWKSPDIVKAARTFDAWVVERLGVGDGRAKLLARLPF